MHRAIGLVAWLWAAPAVMPAQAIQGTLGGTLSGTVVEAKTNRALAGAFVTAKYAGLPPLARTVKSAADGTFAVTDLPAGAYSLCVQVPGGGYLDPCQWLAAVPGAPSAGATMTLGSGQKSTGIVLRIQAGSVLSVRVNDAAQILAQKTKDGREHHLLIGVWGPDRLFYPMRRAATDKAGATYQLTVPQDTALRFVIASRDLKLADAGGAAVAAGGAPQDFQHRTGDANPKSFQYSVTGALP